MHTWVILDKELPKTAQVSPGGIPAHCIHVILIYVRAFYVTSRDANMMLSLLIRVLLLIMFLIVFVIIIPAIHTQPQIAYHLVLNVLLLIVIIIKRLMRIQLILLLGCILIIILLPFNLLLLLLLNYSS